MDNKNKKETYETPTGSWAEESTPEPRDKADKRTRTAGSSEKKMAAPSKRSRVEEMDVDDEGGGDDDRDPAVDLDDPIMTSLLDSSGDDEPPLKSGANPGPKGEDSIVSTEQKKECKGTNDTQRSRPEPEKSKPVPEESNADVKNSRKRKQGKTKKFRVDTPDGPTWAERAKSAFLLTITKGEAFENLSPAEHRELMNNLEDDIFTGKYEKEPKFDWSSWKDRSMLACADEASVKWAKKIIKKMMPSLSAWLPNEGPFLISYHINIPPPTSGRKPEEIIERIIKANKLKGGLTLVRAKRNGGVLSLTVGADQEMATSLAQINYRVHCGLTKLCFVKTAKGKSGCSCKVCANPPQPGGAAEMCLRNQD